MLVIYENVMELENGVNMIMKQKKYVNFIYIYIVEYIEMYFVIYVIMRLIYL